MSSWVRRASVGLLAVVLLVTTIPSVASPVTVTAAPLSTTTSSFLPLASSRIVGADAPVALSAGRVQYATVAGRNGVPAGVSAARLVVTFAPAAAAVELRVHASGTTPPLVPTLVANAVGEPLVRSIVVPVGANGQIEFRPSGAGVMTVDLIGVFVPTTSSSAGRFVAADPVLLAEVAGARSISAALPSSVPADASAIVLSLTSWSAAALGTWLAADGSPAVMAVPGRVVSNEVVVRPVAGRVNFTSAVSSRMAVELVGWFTGGTASVATDGLYVVAPPTRLLDTTSAPNPLGFGVALHSRWTVETAVVPFTGASAVVVRVGGSSAHTTGSTTVYPAGRGRATYGQVHASGPGAASVVEVTVGVSTRGIAAYSSGGTELVLDVVGWFTGTASTAPAARPVNVMPSGERFPGLLMIPRIRLTTGVLDDTALVDFDPAHLPESRSPNQPGNTALFGHRTSKGREFRNIDRIRPGDPIYLALQGKIYVYSATSVQVLSPDDPRLYASNSNDQTLTLVACHPPGSVRQRVVVFAYLKSVTSL